MPVTTLLRPAIATGMDGGRMNVGEVVGLLDDGEAAFRAEYDQLLAEAERIGALLSPFQPELERAEIESIRFSSRVRRRGR